MKLLNIFTILALLAICLASDISNPANNLMIHYSPRMVQDTLVGTLTLGVSFIPPPFGIIMSILTSVCYQAFNMYRDNEQKKKDNEKKKFLRDLEEKNFLFYNDQQKKKNEIIKANWMQQYEAESSRQAEIFDEIKEEIQLLSNRMDMSFNKQLKELPDLINDKQLLKNMKYTLNIFNQTTSRTNLECLNRLDCSKKIRGPLMKKLLDSGSDFRIKLNIFVREYMGSSLVPGYVDVLGLDSNIVDIIVKQQKALKDNVLYCDNTRSSHEGAYSFFKYILLTIVKSYSMVISAHIQEYRISKKNNEKYPAQWIVNSMDIMKEFRRDVIMLVKAMQVILSNTSREIRRCDPKVHEKGVTYDRFTHIFHTQLFFRRYLPTTELDEIWMSKKCLDGFKDKSPQHTKLNIKLYDSVKAEIGNSRWNELCSPKFHEIYIDPSDHERDFHHFTYSIKNIPDIEKSFVTLSEDEDFGNSSGKNLEQINSHLAYCTFSSCLVDGNDSTHSYRRISLDEVNASQNHVVTGIRWVFIDRILHLQIKEGKFKNGFINPDTVKWKKISKKVKNVLYVNSTHSIGLYDHVIPAKFYVTGLQLVVTNEVLVIKLAMKKLKKDGKKLSDNSTISFEYNIRKAEIKFNDDSPPNLAPPGIQSRVITKSGENIIKFQASSFKKDASQSVLPYFDFQEVVTNPPCPIGGIGFYLKGVDSYSGFVALKIISADRTHALKVNDFEKFFTQSEINLKHGFYNKTNIGKLKWINKVSKAIKNIQNAAN